MITLELTAIKAWHTANSTYATRQKEGATTELRYDPLDSKPYLLITIIDGGVTRTQQCWLTEDELDAYLLEKQMLDDVWNDFYHDMKYQAWQE